MDSPHIALTLRRNGRPRPHLLLVAVGGPWMQGLARILRRQYHVYPADGPPPAMRIARQNFPDVVVIDADGLAGMVPLIRDLRRIAEIQPVPILVLALQTTRDDVLEAVAAGATDYLLKPQMQADTLFGRIDTALKGLAFHGPAVNPNISLRSHGEENGQEPANLHE